MRYVTKPVYLDAIQFQYSPAGIEALQEFTDGHVIRHGPRRLPTMGGFAYVKFPDQILIIDEGDYVIKWLNTGEYYNMPEKEFREKFDPTENTL